MNNKMIIVGVIGLALVGLAVFQFNGNKKAAPTDQQKEVVMQEKQPTGSDVVKEEVTSAMEKGEYVDGTYTAEGNYTSPAGEEEVKVTITLESGKIVESEFESLATAPKSKAMQALFGKGYKELVIGKNIDEVDLDVVNGSSLTPLGFEDALEKIKQQATS